MSFVSLDRRGRETNFQANFPVSFQAFFNLWPPLRCVNEAVGRGRGSRQKAEAGDKRQR